MTTNAKLLLAALGVVALAATPAMAATHHVRTHHVQIHRVVPQQVAPVAVQRVAPVATYERRQLPDDYYYYDGYQSDRQMVGVGLGTGD